MIESVDYKVPGGKLLRIDADISGNVIRWIRLHGDFFLHPEEAISDIEKSLAGTDLNFSRMLDRLKTATAGVRMIGISAGDICLALEKLKLGLAETSGEHIK